MAATYTFGRHAIAATEVFLTTPLVYAMVNWKPVRPGHVLVVTRRGIPRLADATPAEVADLFATARAVGVAMEARAAASGLTLVVQDGAAAGQTVPHVHVHLIPRHAGDFARNDDVYDAVDAANLTVRPTDDAGGGKTPPPSVGWMTRTTGSHGRQQTWRPRRPPSARSLRTCLGRSKRPPGERVSAAEKNDVRQSRTSSRYIYTWGERAGACRTDRWVPAAYAARTNSQSVAHSHSRGRGAAGRWIGGRENWPRTPTGRTLSAGQQRTSTLTS